MTTYVALANWTDQGARAVADSPRRLDAARKTLEEMGGRFVSLLMTMGEYDLVLVYEAPDDAVAARFTLLLGKQGSAHQDPEGLPRAGVPGDHRVAGLSAGLRKAPRRP